MIIIIITHRIFNPHNHDTLNFNPHNHDTLNFNPHNHDGHNHNPCHAHHIYKPNSMQMQLILCIPI